MYRKKIIWGFFLYLLIFFFFFFLIFLICFYSHFPGYAKYRNIFSFRQARFLWYAESGTDICYPVPGLANLYFEVFPASSEVRLAICDVRLQMEESARIEDFMRVYEARFLLQAQLIRAYSNMPESIRSRHWANLYYEVQADTVFNHIMLPTNGRRRPRPY